MESSSSNIQKNKYHSRIFKYKIKKYTAIERSTTHTDHILKKEHTTEKKPPSNTRVKPPSSATTVRGRLGHTRKVPSRGADSLRPRPPSASRGSACPCAKGAGPSSARAASGGRAGRESRAKVHRPTVTSTSACSDRPPPPTGQSSGELWQHWAGYGRSLCCFELGVGFVLYCCVCLHNKVLCVLGRGSNRESVV